jgi:uncharacterized membrane protein YfcA
MHTFALLLGAGFLAGAMNAVAGGGSFITLPALMLAGVPSAAANASSTVALLPGSLASLWAYRDEPTVVGEVSLRALVGISLVGGFIGALLLLLTPQTAFDAVLPWLLLLATGVFAFGQRAGEALRRRVRMGARPLLAAQLLLAIYGGYFGGAVGIMMMAVWSLLSSMELKAMNPAKTLLVAATNTVAMGCFVIAGKVWWPQTLALLGAAVLGGYVSARVSRHLDPRYLRLGIVSLSALTTLAFFLRAR